MVATLLVGALCNVHIYMRIHGNVVTLPVAFCPGIALVHVLVVLVFAMWLGAVTLSSVNAVTGVHV